MAISDMDLSAVKRLISDDRAIPAIVVRAIVERLDRLERLLCATCEARRAATA